MTRLSVDSLLHHLPCTRIRLLAFVLGSIREGLFQSLRSSIAHEIGQRFSSDGTRSV
jgi:hypothetical protein